MTISASVPKLFPPVPAAFALLLAVGVVRASQAQAATLWNGPAITFTKPNGADWTLPANQDRMTPDVWLTRDTTEGLFNAATESGYTHFFSPQNTSWAYGTLANYASLTYTDWEDWNGHNPPSMVGRAAVLHLVSDDIYLSIKFDSWGGSAGGFSYDRSTPVVPEPSFVMLILAGLGLAGGVRVCRRVWR